MSDGDQLVVAGKTKRRSERRRVTRKRHNKRAQTARLAESRVEHFARHVRGSEGDPVVTDVYRDLKSRARRLKRRARC